MARLPSTKTNLNLKTDQYSQGNIGTSTMATDQQEARVIGIPGKDGTNAGSGTYTNTDPVPYDVGGIESGETFYSVPLEDMWNKLLYPYVQPIFSAFSMVTGTILYEVGDTLIGGFKTFTWSTTYPGNINPDSISIDQNGTTIANGLTDDGSEYIDIGIDITPTSSIIYTWLIKSLNTDNSVSSKSFLIEWKWSNYYGISLNASLTEAEILDLPNKNLVDNYVGTYSYPPLGYKYICYPVLFGQYTTAKDVDTGFAIAMNDPIIINILNSYGISEDYYVYRTTNIINGSINIILE